MPVLSGKLEKKGFYKLGKLFFDKCDFKQATAYFEKAVDTFKKQKNYEGLLNTYGFLVRIHSEKLEQDRAKMWLAEAQKVLDEDPADVKRSFFHYQVGVMLNFSEPAKATEEFIQSYHEARKENDVELTAKALYAVANSNYSRYRYDEALLYLDKLRELVPEKVNKPYLTGTMFILYGHILRNIEKYEEALEYYFKAHRTLQDKTCWNLYNYVLFGIGKTYKKMGQYDRAVIYLELALNSNDADNFKKLQQELERELDELKDNFDICIDFQNKEVHEARLGKIDFKNRFILLEILFLLSRNPGKEFSKEDLAEKIWGADYNPLIQDKLIYTNVSRLRKLIEPDIQKPKYVVKSRNGYYFNNQAAVKFRSHPDGINETNSIEAEALERNLSSPSS